MGEGAKPKRSLLPVWGAGSVLSVKVSLLVAVIQGLSVAREQGSSHPASGDGVGAPDGAAADLGAVAFAGSGSDVPGPADAFFSSRARSRCSRHAILRNR